MYSLGLPITLHDPRCFMIPIRTLLHAVYVALEHGTRGPPEFTPRAVPMLGIAAVRDCSCCAVLSCRLPRVYAHGLHQHDTAAARSGTMSAPSALPYFLRHVYLVYDTSVIGSRYSIVLLLSYPAVASTTGHGARDKQHSQRATDIAP